MLQGMPPILSSRRPDRGHLSWMCTARGFFKNKADKRKAYQIGTLHNLLGIYLIRSRAFELSEGSSRNWCDTSVRVLSRTCGATMSVTMIFSFSRTKRVARVQK